MPPNRFSDYEWGGGGSPLLLFFSSVFSIVYYMYVVYRQFHYFLPMCGKVAVLIFLTETQCILYSGQRNDEMV